MKQNTFPAVTSLSMASMILGSIRADIAESNAHNFATRC